MMRALILAAGQGTRLQPLVNNKPKADILNQLEKQKYPKMLDNRIIHLTKLKVFLLK